MALASGGYLGYQTPRVGGYRPFAPQENPFGLARAATARPVITPPPTVPAYRPPTQQPQTSPYLTALRGQLPAVPPIAAASTYNRYDIATDPALLQTQSLIGMSNQQAEAAARKQEGDLLLSYGDPNLIQKLLGDSNLAKAAAANPTSTLAQMKQQRERNLNDLTQALNQQNLFYSGYRVKQEQQAAQDYQNALAQAAAGVNSQIGGIQSQLAATEQANQQQLIQAYLAAYQNAMAQGIDPTTGLPYAAAGTAGSGGSPAINFFPGRLF